MRITINKQFSLLLIALLGIILLTACGASDEPTPQPTRFSALDIDRLNAEANSTSIAQTAAANIQQTQVFAPSVVPTEALAQRPTLPSNATRIILSPVPTISVELNEDDVLGNIVAEQDWLLQAFTATDGELYTMQSFQGSVIIVQPMAQNCDSCLDQLLNTREIAQKFVDEERGYDIIYVILNTDTSISTTGLLNWSRSQGVEPSTDLNWVVANASPDLLNAITRTFGADYIDPQNTPILIVDMDGFSHIAESGVMSVNRIRDVLIYYADPPIDVGEGDEQ
jgi:hypothetical protein